MRDSLMWDRYNRVRKYRDALLETNLFEYRNEIERVNIWLIDMAKKLTIEVIGDIENMTLIQNLKVEYKIINNRDIFLNDVTHSAEYIRDERIREVTERAKAEKKRRIQELRADPDLYEKYLEQKRFWYQKSGKFKRAERKK